MYVNDGRVNYTIGKMVAENDIYRLYLCSDDEQMYLLQIASEIEHNGKIDFVAFVLGELKKKSNYYEMEYKKTHPNAMLNYDRLFPCVVSNFTLLDQGNRRANILLLKDVKDIELTVPLSSLIQRHNLSIGLESSGWIMGRLLKLLGIAHECGLSIDITMDNVLIEPDSHHVIVIDWTLAFSHPEGVPDETIRQNIMCSAETVLSAIDGYEKSPIVFERQELYVDFLKELSKYGSKSAIKAHSDFYKTTRAVFDKRFYKFRTIPKDQERGD